MSLLSKTKRLFYDIKTIIPFLINVYLFILGISWVLFFLYIRFVLKRTSYDLTLLKEYIEIKHYILFSAFILIHFLLIFISVLILYLRNKQIKSNSLFNRLSLLLTAFMYKIYIKPLEYIYNILALRIPGSAKIFLYLESVWNTKNFSYMMITIFDIFPKSIALLVFFLEIVIYKQINLFIYALFFLIIPIIFRLFLKILLTFGSYNNNVVEEFFISITGVGDPLGNGPAVLDTKGDIIQYEQYHLLLKPEYIGVFDPQEEFNMLLKFRHIYNIGYFTRSILDEITPYITIVMSSIYILAGSYRLYFLIF